MTAHGVRRFVAAGALLIGVAVVAVSAGALRQEAFPHEQHAGMFPLCEGCHQGVPEGDRASFYPPPASCDGCHDGTERPRVDWQGPTEEPDNVVFEHPDHPLVDDQGGTIDCTSCHTLAGAPRMTVEDEPVVARCLECHEHRAEAHLIDADCTTCHMPLAEAPFGRTRLLALPVPADHEDGAFLAAGHGVMAQAEITRCAVCHTRERCESCHVNAAVLAEIVSMPAAVGIVARELPEYQALYPVPPSHQQPDFIESHGAGASAASCSTCHVREDCTSCHVMQQLGVVNELPQSSSARAPGVQVARYPVDGARYVPSSHQRPEYLENHGDGASAASCSTCHVREDCTSCHLTPQPGMVMDLPTSRDVGASGLQTLRRMPLSHQAPMFARDHGTDAAANNTSCMMCHGPTMCSDCHDTQASGAAAAARSPTSVGAPVRASTSRAGMPGAFHPANYVARHSAEAFGRRLECSNCHDSRLFCADCHESAGMSPSAGRGRLGPGFHDAEPLWLLRHGQAARQGLESCTACHKQNECMQCHSILGAFKVNPHGPGFNARRAQQRNAAVCLVCHITDPLNRRPG